MILKLILKQIKISNNDTDTYRTLIFELYKDKNTDLNYVDNLHHKTIEIDTDKIRIKR